MTGATPETIRDIFGATGYALPAWRLAWPGLLAIALCGVMAGCGPSPGPASNLSPESSPESSPDRTDTAPADVWAQAAQRGVDFRATGNEPGWIVEIREGKTIVVDTHYGTRHYEITASAPVVDADRGSQLYRGEDAVPAFEMILIDAPCVDDMSGEHFPTTVRLQIDDQTFDGCGRPLIQRP